MLMQRQGTLFMLSLGLFVGSSPLAAQGKAQVVPPVEVVATRAPEAPHAVPASIEVITGDNLRARGVTTLKDALSLAAGIGVAPGGDMGPASNVLSFWGLTEFDAFLLVVDGIPWGGALNPAMSTVSLKDVERIEILRGPAPVTFGATSFVGVIHIVHKAGSETSKSISANGGSFGSGSLAADIGLSPMGAWKSRFSIDLDREKFKDDRTGYNRGHASFRTVSGGDDRSTWVNLDVNVLKQDPASPHVREGAALSTSTPLDANYNPAKAYVNETRFVLALGLNRPVMKGATWGTTASLTHSGTREFRGFLTDVSNSANNAAGFKETIDVNDVYFDTHILGPSKNHLRLMAGADALFANGEAKGATFNYTVPLSGATATTVTEPTTLDKDAANRRLFLGVYANAEWQPVEHFTLSAGGRFNSTNERRGEETEPSTSHSRFSGSVGAIYGIMEKGANHVRVFANFKDTFKPAAFDFGLVENEGVLDPETSQSYEGGVKISGMDGKLNVEGSYFNMDFKNLVTSATVNNVPTLQNTGKTRFKGFELAADLNLEHDISARATFSSHDGKFVDFKQEFDPGVPTQLAGKRFEMSAKTLWSAGLIYSPEKGFVANANANFTGDRYLNKRNTALAKSFTTIDAGIGYRSGRYEIRIDGKNLGDKRDAVSESEFGDAQYYRMPARTIRGGVFIKY